MIESLTRRTGSVFIQITSPHGNISKRIPLLGFRPTTSFGLAGYSINVKKSEPFKVMENGIELYKIFYGINE